MRNPYLVAQPKSKNTLLLAAVLKHEKTYRYLLANEHQDSLRAKWEAKVAQCARLKWALGRRRLRQIGFYE